MSRKDDTMKNVCRLMNNLKDKKNIEVESE